ncbi:MAG: Phage portal protein, lambda family [bacterium ADurb.Bin236]|nr:MAG: Phage portal protein, lambda family [bacterium ADurb.Bin236]HOY62138.1 hypothetical protein [bacterium]HPN93713.1 hypothetical protein [bacterium]
MKTENNRGKRPRHRPKNNLTGDVIVPPRLSAEGDIDSSALADLAVSDAVPATWEERAAKAWQYYVSEPIVKNAINSWRTFAIGDEIQFGCDDEDVKWEARELAAKLKLNAFVKNMILNLLVKGECVGFQQTGSDGDDIEKVICVNPNSAKVIYENGELKEMKQHPESAAAGEPIDLPLDRVLHIKWDAQPYSPRGNSMVVPAFESIELLRDYRKAERAVAKRWTTPLRFVQVGGQFGQKTIIPDQRTLNSVRDMINRMDLKAGLVVPFYVKAETYGTEGQVLDTEKKIREIKEDIIIALGLAKSLITGDGPNFATATIGMQKMVIMLKEIKQAARDILNWIFFKWQDMKGYGEKSINYIFNDLDLANEVDIKKLYIELYDRKLISGNSLQIKMDLNPEVESANLEAESKKGVDVTDPRIIIDMVNSGIMSIETAQEKLGLDKEKNRPAASADWPYRPPSLTGSASPDALCDECEFFDSENNWCDAQNGETRFDSRACASFNKKTKEGCGCGR